MKRSLAVLAALASLAALAASAPPPFSVTLQAKDIHEECVHLAAGEKRNYYWRADQPVDFNIHFHRGDEVSYPVKREAMRGDGGTFSAKSAGDYCWMWTARDKATKLDGRILGSG